MPSFWCNLVWKLPISCTSQTRRNLQSNPPKPCSNRLIYNIKTLLIPMASFSSSTATLDYPVIRIGPIVVQTPPKQQIQLSNSQIGDANIRFLTSLLWLHVPSEMKMKWCYTRQLQIAFLKMVNLCQFYKKNNIFLLIIVKLFKLTWLKYNLFC